jgi:hypothetical protein
MDWPWIDQSDDAGQDGNEGDTRGGDFEAAGAVPKQPAPVPEPAEAALHYPAAFEHVKAFAGGIAFDDAVAHAVAIAPPLAAFGDKSAVQHRSRKLG